jgi:hypothetical protein
MERGLSRQGGIVDGTPPGGKLPVEVGAGEREHEVTWRRAETRNMGRGEECVGNEAAARAVGAGRIRPWQHDELMTTLNHSACDKRRAEQTAVSSAKQHLT